MTKRADVLTTDGRQLTRIWEDQIMKFVRVEIVCAVLILAGIVRGTASYRVPAFVDPYTNKSPSGDFVCEVNPSDLHGRGSAHYRVLHKGTVSWEGDKPFTFFESGITDEGIVAGIGYTFGENGFSEGGRKAGCGDFVVAIMDEKGGLRLHETRKREASRYLHSLPIPLATGMALDGPGNRFAVRLDAEGTSGSLWTYELSSGKKAETSLEFAQWVSQHAMPKRQRENAKENGATPPSQKGQLELLGSFNLRPEESADKQVFGSAVEFDFNAKGEIGLLSKPADGGAGFVLIGTNGSIVQHISLPAVEKTNDHAFHLASLEGDEWLFTASANGWQGKTTAWIVNAASGKVERIPGFQCPYVKSVAGTRKGGFAVLVIHYPSQYYLQNELIAFDRRGKEQARNRLFSPEDLAVTTEGEIAVVDNIRHQVQFYSPEGAYVRCWKLEDNASHEWKYPSEISADKSRGVLIRDFHGAPPIVRLNAEGKINTQFQLKYKDGRVLDPIRGVKVSPTGRVWACDGASLARVNDAGEADLVLGGAPTAQTLGEIAAVAVNQRGEICAVDARGGAVHVFDSAGKRLRVGNPAITDFSQKLVMPSVALAEDGEIFLNAGNSFPDPARHVHFSTDGTRLGIKIFDLDSIQEDCYPLPAQNRLLILGYQDAFVVDADGKVVRKIQRRPDGCWLKRPQEAAVAADGSFAILTGSVVSLYSPEGEPVRTVMLPSGCHSFLFAYTGSHLITGDDSQIYIYDAKGEPVLAFQPPFEGMSNHYWFCLGAERGNELWMVSPSLGKVYRFGLPRKQS